LDQANRLTSVNGTLTAATYNGFGQRVTKEPSSSTTFYLYDGDEPVVEENSSGTVTATNTFATAGLVSRRSGGASTFYTFDAKGTRPKDWMRARTSSHPTTIIPLAQE
jgi:hypothetical protein